MPVLPDVHSIIVPPGFILPSASAFSIILSAMRSLVECPGLKYSTLAYTGQGKSATILFIFTMGVSPMVSKMEL